MLGCRSSNRTTSGHVTEEPLHVGGGGGPCDLRFTAALLVLFSLLLATSSSEPPPLSFVKTTTPVSDDFRFFGEHVDRELASAAAVVMVVDVDDVIRRSRGPGLHRRRVSGTSKRSRLASLPISRVYRLYSRCSNKYLRVAGSNIDAQGTPNDRYAQLEFVTDNFDSRLRIRALESRDYICFNRQGSLIVKASGNDDRCVFRELNSLDDYTELQSVVDVRWYLGFDRAGRRINASARPQVVSRPPASSSSSPIITTFSIGETPAAAGSNGPTLVAFSTTTTAAATIRSPSNSSRAELSSAEASRSAASLGIARLPWTSPPTTAATSVDHRFQHHRQRRHRLQLRRQRQHQHQQQRQQKHRVRHNHRQQRRRQCFQFVKTEVFTRLPAAAEPSGLAGASRYVAVDAAPHRRSFLKPGKNAVGTAGRRRPSDDDTRFDVGELPQSKRLPQQQGPPVDFRQVYANLGSIALHPKRSSSLTDPT